MHLVGSSSEIGRIDNISEEEQLSEGIRKYYNDNMLLALSMKGFEINIEEFAEDTTLPITTISGTTAATTVEDDSIEAKTTDGYDKTTFSQTAGATTLVREPTGSSLLTEVTATPTLTEAPSMPTSAAQINPETTETSKRLVTTTVTEETTALPAIEQTTFLLRSEVTSTARDEVTTVRPEQARVTELPSSRDLEAAELVTAGSLLLLAILLLAGCFLKRKKLKAWRRSLASECQPWLSGGRHRASCMPVCGPASPAVSGKSLMYSQAGTESSGWSSPDSSPAPGPLLPWDRVITELRAVHLRTMKPASLPPLRVGQYSRHLALAPALPNQPTRLVTNLPDIF